MIRKAVLILILAAAACAAHAAQRPAVVYFSRGGNTRTDLDASSSPSLRRDANGEYRGDAQEIAGWIAEETGGELFAVKTVKKYLAGYDEVISEARSEKRAKARPALAEKLDGLGSYATVYLVFPNWWGDLPMPLYTFFETHELAAKKLIVVVTSGGSGFSDTIRTLRRLVPKAEVIKGPHIYKRSMDTAKAEILNWLRGQR
ncbi:MAG: hypothetical protein J6Z30_05580 [Pyramidobacter sp.]|nr:hypothetical protein [Pyramidobacter sp.]